MSHEEKRIAILGSTGSIGTQALEVIAAYPTQFKVELLTANSQWELLVKQAIAFQPNAVVIAQSDYYPRVKEALKDQPIKVFAGIDSIAQAVTMESIDLVLTAMVGFSGLLPTIAAIKAGKPIALANKETLVVAGSLISSLAKQYRVPILPVDSEHSAIFQCLVGEGDNPIHRLMLTASGGPFRGKKTEELINITREQALKHPNWSMGAKITIDSASLMNKGLEVIEAHWLFGIPSNQIDVVVHPQSIIHSMVEFADGSIKAQLGLPDMRLPILYAFTYPNRFVAPFPRMDFGKFNQLTFEAPDVSTFRNLALAFSALETGGTMPCVLNAANEIAVSAFLNDQVGFLAMSDVIESTMNRISVEKDPDLATFLAIDEEARRIAFELI